MNCRFAIVLMPVFLILPMTAVGAGMDMLIKMSNAIHRMDYSGTLVHIKGDDVNTLRVEHSVVSGVENETVTSLNDEKGSVSSQTQSFSLAMVPSSIEQMQEVYSLDVGAIKKVAKRNCQIVVARPKDKMRYLQKYCLDNKTGLPLDYTLIDNKRRTVERFTFTNVSISAAKGTDNANVASAVAPPQTWIPDNTPQGKWSIEKMPKGFHFGKRVATQQAEVQKGPNTEHFVLTDGLSSISVFISPKTTTKQKTASSLSSGALNVLTSHKNNHRITLVGEVPRATMQSILSSLKYQGNP